MKSIGGTLILFLISIGAYAQIGTNTPNHLREEREKLLQMKVTYVKENLALNEAENARFWAQYEENLKKEEALRQKQRSMVRKIKRNYKGMTDADIEKSIEDEIAVEQQLLDLKKAQFEAYKKLIPLQKIVELRQIERSFNRMLMEKLRDKKAGPPPVHD